MLTREYTSPIDAHRHLVKLSMLAAGSPMQRQIARLTNLNHVNLDTQTYTGRKG